RRVRCFRSCWAWASPECTGRAVREARAGRRPNTRKTARGPQARARPLGPCRARALPDRGSAWIGGERGPRERSREELLSSPLLRAQEQDFPATRRGLEARHLHERAAEESGGRGAAEDGAPEEADGGRVDDREEHDPVPAEREAPDTATRGVERRIDPALEPAPVRRDRPALAPRAHRIPDEDDAGRVRADAEPALHAAPAGQEDRTSAAVDVAPEEIPADVEDDELAVGTDRRGHTAGGRRGRVERRGRLRAVERSAVEPVVPQGRVDHARPVRRDRQLAGAAALLADPSTGCAPVHGSDEERAPGGPLLVGQVDHARSVGRDLEGYLAADRGLDRAQLDGRRETVRGVDLEETVDVAIGLEDDVHAVARELVLRDVRVRAERPAQLAADDEPVRPRREQLVDAVVVLVGEVQDPEAVRADLEGLDVSARDGRVVELDGSTAAVGARREELAHSHLLLLGEIDREETVERQLRPRRAHHAASGNEGRVQLARVRRPAQRQRVELRAA